VGEVWVCSGQSNMEQSVAASRDPKEAIANSAYPQIRLYTVPRTPAAAPQSEVPQGKQGAQVWKECGPQTVGGFSAVAYYFGRALHKSRNVPVGLIHSSWGATAAQRWTSQTVLEKTPGLQELKGQKGASNLYNGMIAPLMPFAIKGV